MLNVLFIVYSEYVVFSFSSKKENERKKERIKERKKEGGKRREEEWFKMDFFVCSVRFVVVFSTIL